MQTTLRFLAPQARRFDRLVRPHLPSLHAFAARLSGNRDDAEDVVQDLLTKLYPRTAELAGIRDLRPWLHRTLYNQFIDGIRKRQSRPELATPEQAGIEPPADATADPLWQLTSSERAARIDAALRQLEPEQRALVALHLMEGRTLEELTEVFDVPLGTLKSRVHRLRAKLKVMLALEPSAPRIRGEGIGRPCPSAEATGMVQ